MFEKFKKDRQLVDIVRTENGVYLTVNFKDKNYPRRESFYKEPFKIRGDNYIDNVINTLAKKNPKYKLKCHFKTRNGNIYDIKGYDNKPIEFEDYIIKLDSLVNDEFLAYKKNELIEPFISENLIYSKIKEWYYMETFKRILKRNIGKSLDVDFLPSTISLNKNGTHLSVVRGSRNDFYNYENLDVDLYELTRIYPRKKILSSSRYIAKKITSGFIRQIGGNFGINTCQMQNEMGNSGRYTKLFGLPAEIIFNDEFCLIDPVILEMRKLEESKK